jgi:hypothetical protein
MTQLGKFLAAIGAASLTLSVTLPARADEHRGEGRHEGAYRGESRRDAHLDGSVRGERGGEGRRDTGRWNGRIEHFHERDYRIWNGGHWEHGRHEGRYGWWWLAGGLWYFYPIPVYPYPDPYAPPVVYVPQVAPQPAAPLAPPPAQYWYYCDSAGAYYPYAPACPSGWRAVPANP